MHLNKTVLIKMTVKCNDSVQQSTKSSKTFYSIIITVHCFYLKQNCYGYVVHFYTNSPVVCKYVTKKQDAAFFLSIYE